MEVAVLAALVSAGVSGAVSLTTWGLGYLTRRDEKRIRIEVERQLLTERVSLEARVRLELEGQLAKERVSLDGHVRAIVDGHLKVHDARLKVAVEWRLKMLERMLEAGSSLRLRVNAVFGAVNKLTHEASLRGRTGTTQELVSACDEAIRGIAIAGGFLTPALTEHARTFIRDFEEIADGIVVWANAPTEEKRHAGCDATNEQVAALGRRVADTFAQWQSQMWELQEQALLAPDASKLPRLPLANPSGV